MRRIDESYEKKYYQKQWATYDGKDEHDKHSTHFMILMSNISFEIVEHKGYH